MSTTLYVIGNGFDLHHGIRSTFREFGQFLKAHDPKTYDLVVEYLAFDDEFWAHFEARLADFDSYTVMQNFSHLIVSYGAEEWSESFHHDYQFEIEQVVRALSSDMKAAFAKWIRHLEMPDPIVIRSRLLGLDISATFLNFNYTPSLAKLYNVNPSQVLHIHGSAASANSALIVGHGWDPEDKGSLNDGLDLENTDTREVDGNQIIDGYFKQTFKPTDQIIAANRSFFEALRETKQVILMGHSLADVDLPYFKEIIRCIRSDEVLWTISYHDDPGLISLRQQLLKLPTISEHRVKFEELANM